jgi:CMP-N-acetylneuraminic acid synthetase
MIPVRKGSQRLAKKNYLQINGKAVYEIAIEKALSVNLFDKVVLNTDDPTLESVVKKFGIDFYLRESQLASSEATSEMVVLDFFKQYNCDRVFWLNTVSPLQTINDIKNFFNQTIDDNASSSVAVSKNQVHATFKGEPINYEWDQNFAKTQDMTPVLSFNYSMMSWHKNEIEMLENGQLFNDSTTMIESSIWSNILLKSKQDFDLIEKLSAVSPN